MNTWLETGSNSAQKQFLAVKPGYNGQRWDSKKVAAVQKWLLFRGWSLKITIQSW